MSVPTKAETATERALVLADLGFYVFPSWAKNRHIPGWPQRATRDPEQIRAWFGGTYRDCWPSIFTGRFGEDRSLIVVDVDPRGIEAVESGTLEPLLPDTRVHQTPRGGFHGLYSAPFPGVKSGTDVLADGVDIRSKGGLIHFGIGYTIEQDLPIAEAPPELIAKCGDLAPKTTPADRAHDRIAPDQEAAMQRGEELLSRTPRATDGGRNVALRDFVYRLRESCATDADSTLALGLAFAAEHCDPPYPETEARATIASATRSAQNPAGAMAALPEDFEIVPMTIQQTAAAVIAQAAKRDADLLWAGSVSIPRVWPDRYLVKGLLNAGDDAQLFGETNLGKTFLALNIAAHVAAGAPWMGQKTAQAGVLMLAYEGLQAMPLRLAALRQQYPGMDWDSLPLAVVPMRAPLVDDRTADQNTLPGRKRLQGALEAFAQRTGRPPGLIVIDTYSKALGGSTSDEGLATKFAHMAQALIAAYGATVLRIHHPGHGNKDRARGSYSLRAGVDSDIHVEDGLIHTPKQRDGQKRRFGFRLEPVTLGHDQDGDPVTSCIVVPGPAMNALDLTERQAAVMALILEAAGDRGEVGRTAVRAAATAQGVSARDLRNTLAELKQKGRIDFTREIVRVLERGAAAVFDD